MAAIELVDRPLLHIGDVARDLARIVCILRLARIHLIDCIAGIRKVDVQRIVFDIAHRPLVDTAEGILRIIRTAKSRDRQRVALGRMTIARKSAIELLAVCTRIRLCRAVIRDLAALEPANLEQYGIRFVYIRIRHETELMRLSRCAVLRRPIVLEFQRIGGVAALQEGNALDAVQTRDIRKSRSINGELAPVNARAREIARIGDGQHCIAERSCAVQFEFVVLEIVDGLRRSILGVDAERIARHIIACPRPVSAVFSAIDIGICKRCTRDICMRVIAKVDGVARRRAIQLPRHAAVDIAAERAARDRDGIVVCSKVLRGIGRTVIAARTAIDIVLECAARNRDLVARHRSGLI